MRLFIALDLSVEVRRELRDVQLRLSEHSRAVRWSDPMGMHLTLQFLGETPASLAQPLVTALNAIETPPFTLHLDRLGCFPATGSLRVVWVGIRGDLTGLTSLYQAVTTVTQELGLPADSRPFTPHITLARARPAATPAELRALRLVLPAVNPKPVSWQPQRPILFRSQLTSRGAIYTALN
ncbi:RNA 2',3'-cyclic phosphodiesterase [Chloroflexus sp.]|uniref:RNA 2',3'-cyclic phosphodiesterase n=1 Tax=Chloroflexus sp. TaxID=1904827 RepID=UPI0026208BDE|nr:RNA 2',3'-cyclic phosphodiesterase [uncultured Chloroflexus sp.]